MNFKSFIEKYDVIGSVVLLEGKREVKVEDIIKLIRLGELLATETKYCIFRSGNASGADEYFSQGVCNVDANRLEVIAPYKGHRKKNTLGYKTYSLDEIDIINEPEIIYQSKGNKKRDNLIDEYVSGNKNILSSKGAYLIRDTVKVIGSSTGISRASAAIFYDDLLKPKQGGTGHTMEVCERNGVEVIDQRVWMAWLRKINVLISTAIVWHSE